jgi:hypothetical protein
MNVTLAPIERVFIDRSLAKSAEIEAPEIFRIVSVLLLLRAGAATPRWCAPDRGIKLGWHREAR